MGHAMGGCGVAQPGQRQVKGWRGPRRLEAGGADGVLDPEVPDQEVLGMVAWLGRRLSHPSETVRRKSLQLISRLSKEGHAFRSAAVGSLVGGVNLAGMQPGLGTDARECLAALEPEVRTMVVAVPPGVGAGDPLEVETPDGQELELEVCGPTSAPLGRPCSPPRCCVLHGRFQRA